VKKPNLFSDSDAQYMSRAIELAKKGRFTTSPNPNVGCVIVKDKKIIGEGFHFKAGEPHAEVHALKQASGKAKGATAYVTLEPCSHFGRTPPCAEALCKAGVTRVVVALVDPNPKVAGKGIAILENQGIQVNVGLLESDAEKLNLGFIKRMKTKLPRVTVKLASSLDGKTALKNGESKWITGPSARVDVQYYRAQQSAILSGVDTVIIDDASLNVRFDDLQQSRSFNDEITRIQTRQPLRIILDSHNRLTLKEKIFTLEGEVLIVSLTARDDLHSAGVMATVNQTIAPKNEEGRVDLDDLLRELGKREINDLWIEAGATLSGEFFVKNSVDQFILYQAPKLMGDQAKNLVNLPNFLAMSDVVHLSLKNIKQIEQDIRLTFVRN